MYKNNQLVTVKRFLSEAYEESALINRGKEIAAYVKIIRMFGVCGVTNNNQFEQVKNFFLDLSFPICYNAKSGLIWVREVGESLDRLFSGLVKFS